MTGILTLCRGHMSATVCPDIGGALASLRWRGIDLLRPAPEDATVRQMGMFALLPYSNRIGHGRLPGETPLRANFPPEPHSVHGFGWQRSWQVTQAGPEHARLELAHSPDLDWPFACHAALAFSLSDDGVALQLSLRNADTRAMPAGLGFHPYFPVDQSTRLRAHWDLRWELDDAHLPTHAAPLTRLDDFRRPRPVSAWVVDNCFTGWDGSAMLDYATHSVHIGAGPECPHLVCFRPGDGRPFIALEPVSHVSNAHQLQERGVSGTGLRILAPGATFAINMAIRAMSTERAP
jgi:aldose 1-epimerase